MLIAPCASHREDGEATITRMQPMGSAWFRAEAR